MPFTKETKPIIKHVVYYSEGILESNEVLIFTHVKILTFW